MYFVYILKSKISNDKFYVGITDNIERRLEEHNSKPTNSYTVKYAPWDLVTYVVLRNRRKAEKLEIYFKSHSGRIFYKSKLI